MSRSSIENRWRIIVLMLAGVFAQPVHAGPTFDEICIFGDSLSDPGNVFEVTHHVSTRPYALIPDAPYPIGRLTFSNGPTWIQQLAASLGLRNSAKPALRSAGRFCNYAFGGARARPVGPFSVTEQVGSFLADRSGDVANEKLYVVFIGGNDLRDALGDPANALSILQAAVTAIVDNIMMLAGPPAVGSRFLVLNAPNLGLVPAVRLQGPAAQAGATFLSSQFNAALAGALDQLRLLFPQIHIDTVDVFAVLTATVTSPPEGVTNVIDPCITPGVRRKAVCAGPDGYVVWDGIHPTETLHGILAAAAAQVLSPVTVVAGGAP